MGKVVLQQTVHDEVGYLLRELQSAADGGPVDPCSWLSRAVANIICSIIYGTRFDYNDEVNRYHIRLVSLIMRKSIALLTRRIVSSRRLIRSCGSSVFVDIL